VRAKSSTSGSIVHTEAWRTLGHNLEAVSHMLAWQHREAIALRATAKRMAAKTIPDLTTKSGRAKLMHSAKRFRKTLDAGIKRSDTARLWSVVILVTCVEAYLQDVLSIAASVDPKLMRDSEQHALYADVIRSASLEELENEMRARQARGWLSDGGPARWISRLGAMGARNYSNDLGARLERIWGIRHVVVHAAGIATADFVKRHPGVAAARGDRLRVTNRDEQAFLGAVGDFVEPTEAFFLARYPAIAKVNSLKGTPGDPLSGMVSAVLKPPPHNHTASAAFPALRVAWRCLSGLRCAGLGA
jgi:hypothetical protein